MDDLRAGAILRALRRRRGLRQSDIAKAAGLAQTTISLIERGHLERLSLVAVRRVFQAVDARFESRVLWRGSEVDRLLDLRHARIQNQVVGLISAFGWQAVPEISYAHYGERGSIDILGLHLASRSVAVFEIKSVIGSMEATQRKHDEKVRLAPGICFERWGWKPTQVARILVLPENPQLRRVARAHGALFGATYPASSRDVRRWLRSPVGALSGLWFLSPSNPSAGVSMLPSRSRVVRRSREPGKVG